MTYVDDMLEQYSTGYIIGYCTPKSGIVMCACEYSINRHKGNDMSFLHYREYIRVSYHVDAKTAFRREINLYSPNHILHNVQGFQSRTVTMDYINNLIKEANDPDLLFLKLSLLLT